MNSIVKCEKCGTPMVPFQKDGSQGMTCPKCGWGWATTYTTPIMLDEDQNRFGISLNHYAGKEGII